METTAAPAATDAITAGINAAAAWKDELDLVADRVVTTPVEASGYVVTGYNAEGRLIATANVLPDGTVDDFDEADDENGYPADDPEVNLVGEPINGILDTGEPLVEAMFGKFIAVPFGEPTAKDERERAFDTEEDANAYAMALVVTLTMDDKRARDCNAPFVTVLQFRDDEEAREEAKRDAAEGMGQWPMHTPYGWADTRDGYAVLWSGSWEDSARLFGVEGEGYDDGAVRVA